MTITDINEENDVESIEDEEQEQCQCECELTEDCTIVLSNGEEITKEDERFKHAFDNMKRLSSNLEKTHNLVEQFKSSESVWNEDNDMNDVNTMNDLFTVYPGSMLRPNEAAEENEDESKSMVIHYRTVFYYMHYGSLFSAISTRCASTIDEVTDYETLIVLETGVRQTWKLKYEYRTYSNNNFRPETCYCVVEKLIEIEKGVFVVKPDYFRKVIGDPTTKKISIGNRIEIGQGQCPVYSIRDLDEMMFKLAEN